MISGNSNLKRIVIGTDHRGKDIFDQISKFLDQEFRCELLIANSLDDDPVDYPDIAAKVAHEISCGNADCGILICGTGIGMCVVANKFPGVRAAPCHNEVAAELSRKHNDSNVLCLAGDMLGERSTLTVVEKWLSTEFSGGRHQERLEKIRALENRIYRHDRDKGEDALGMSMIGHESGITASAS